MVTFSFSTIRGLLTLLVLLAILPPMGILLYTSVEEQRRGTEAVHTEARRLSLLAAAYQGEMVEGARQLLVAAAHYANDRPDDCSRHFRRLRELYPNYLDIGAADPDGNVICSALSLSRPTNIGERLYFRQAVERRGFVIGEYQVGRLTSKQSLNLGLPVMDEAGSIVAVAFATLDLDWLNTVASRLRLPPGLSLSMRDRNGVILARYPEPEKWKRAFAKDITVPRAIKAHPEGGIVEDTGVDGIERIYAFQPVMNGAAGTDIYVSVGLPKEMATAASAALWRNLSLLALAALLALCTAWVAGRQFVVKPVRSLVEIAQRLAKGELHARIGLKSNLIELAALTDAFDDMASAMERRERALKATIGEQTATLRALEESEARYRTLFEKSPVGILIIDPETMLPVAFNETAHRQLGYSREEFSRLMVPEYEALERPHETLEHVKKLFREGHDRFETLHRTKEGEIRNVQVNVNTVTLSGQTLFYCTFLDFTEIRRTSCRPLL